MLPVRRPRSARRISAGRRRARPSRRAAAGAAAARRPVPAACAAGLEIDARVVSSRLERFIHDETHRAGLEGVVIGVSGGIDSAVSATLAVRALGPENVLAVLMPYRTSSPESRGDAEDLARRLGVRHEVVEISPMVDAYLASRPEVDRVRRGNKMARERMSILYDLSSAGQALVLGTSNRTEILLGYGTHFGDTACALNPIGDLYKTQVRALAGFLAVPERIRHKVPSADLWPGQTDEGELGYSYADLDRLLILMVDRRLGDAVLAKRGFSPQMIREVRERVERNRFKSRPPLIARVRG